jgi:hypothetical protein
MVVQHTRMVLLRSSNDAAPATWHAAQLQLEQGAAMLGAEADWMCWHTGSVQHTMVSTA